METSRREWLKIAGGGAAVVGVLGVVAAKKAFARSSLYNELIAKATPVLNNKANKELDDLRSQCRLTIREYFHGVCPNFRGFVDHICSELFIEKLAACQSEQDKHRLLNVAFSQKVVTGPEVLNRVETIAKRAGAELDSNWARCCAQLASEWTTTLQLSHDIVDVAHALKPQILSRLESARRTAYPAGQRPATSQTLIEIGEGTVMLLAVELIAPEIELPVFVVKGLVPLWRWLLDRFSDPEKDLQSSMTDQLALLGNSVGDEFQSELRIRIADLQQIQGACLHDAARREVDETLPSLF